MAKNGNQKLVLEEILADAKTKQIILESFRRSLVYCVYETWRFNISQLNIEVTFIEGPKKGQIWIHKNLSLPDIFEFYESRTLRFIRETNSFVFDDSHRIELSEFMYTVIKKIDPSIGVPEPQFKN